jgi:hypothetical protein
MITLAMGRKAPCADRSVPPAGSGSDDIDLTIDGGIPLGHSFHFFIDRSLRTPACVGPFWLRWTLDRADGTPPEQTSDVDLLGALERCQAAERLTALSRLWGDRGPTVEGLVLPEEPVDRVSEATPVWLVRPTVGDGIELTRHNVRWLRERMAQFDRAGSLMGRKGLRLGMSAVECWLSRTGTIFPGDCDRLVKIDGQRWAIVEFKRHNLAVPIGEHLAARYYPAPDGRKYDALFMLRDRLEELLRAKVIVVVLYFAPRQAQFRWQVLRRRAGLLDAVAESPELPYEVGGAVESDARAGDIFTRGFMRSLAAVEY